MRFPRALFRSPRRNILLVLVVVLFIIFKTSWTRTLAYYREPILGNAALNKTLGFGAIYVLTEDDKTWRVEGLRKAAQLSGLRLTVPIQRRPSDEKLFEHVSGDNITQPLDEVRAVLNYLSLIDLFLQSGHETALFVEDDVDFGIDIRSQMTLVSDILLAQSPQTGKLDSNNEHEIIISPELKRNYPYTKDAWDVLWIGHFGLEYTLESHDWPYLDPHALPWNELSSDFNDYYSKEAELQALTRPQQQHIIHSAAPMATYAFALTRKSAMSITARMEQGRVQKFDLALHIMCKGLDLLCVAPAPELMHHHKVLGQRSISSAGIQDDGKHDLQWWRGRHKYTYNIKWSARCNAEGVGEKVETKWQCLPRQDDEIV